MITFVKALRMNDLEMLISMRKFLICQLLLFILLVPVSAQQNSPVCDSQDVAQKHFELGKRHQAWEGEEEQSISEYLIAIKLRRGIYLEAWFNLSQVYGGLMRFPDALAALRNYAAQSKTTDAVNIENQILLLTRAIAAQDLIKSGRDQSAKPFLEIVEALNNYYRFDKSEEYLEAALKKYPDCVEANLQLFRLHRSTPDRIAELIANALIYGSNRADVHSAAGTFYYREKQNFLDAIREYREALRLDPRYAGAWFGLGQTLPYVGQRKEAVEAFQNYLKYTEHLTTQDTQYVRAMIRSIETP